MMPIAWKPTVEAKMALESAKAQNPHATINGLITAAIERCYLHPGAVRDAAERRHVSLEELEGLAAYIAREAYRRGKRGDGERDTFMARARKLAGELPKTLQDARNRTKTAATGKGSK